MSRTEQSASNAMKKVLYHFLSKTETLYEISEENENNDFATEVMERFQLYLMYISGGKNADVYQYLIDAGYDKDEVKTFLNRCSKCNSKIQGTEAYTQKDCRDRILKWFEKDTWKLVKNVLADSTVDPHYSAVTAERRIQLYMECQDDPQLCSVSGFLKEWGCSGMQVDLFYEKCRSECLRWYNGEPREPIYENGKLRSYEVEGLYVVGVRDLDERGTIAPRGAEFDAERNCVWTYRLKLLDDGQPDSYLNKTLEELEREYGNVHVWPELEEYGKVPAYVTNRGYLACFLLEGGRVSDIQRIDLCER